MPDLPIMMPPVGKSGPLMHSMSSSRVQSGFLTMSFMPSITSLRLWGGIFVAMPTAMPTEPLQSRFGNLEGSTAGSLRRSS